MLGKCRTSATRESPRYYRLGRHTNPETRNICIRLAGARFSPKSSPPSISPLYPQSGSIKLCGGSLSSLGNSMHFPSCSLLHMHLTMCCRCSHHFSSYWDASGSFQSTPPNTQFGGGRMTAVHEREGNCQVWQTHAWKGRREERRGEGRQLSLNDV